MRFARHTLNSSTNGDQVNKDKADGACSIGDNSYRSYLKNQEGKVDLKELSVDGRIIQNGYYEISMEDWN